MLTWKCSVCRVRERARAVSRVPVAELLETEATATGNPGGRGAVAEGRRPTGDLLTYLHNIFSWQD